MTSRQLTTTFHHINVLLSINKRQIDMKITVYSVVELKKNFIGIIRISRDMCEK